MKLHSAPAEPAGQAGLVAAKACSSSGPTPKAGNDAAIVSLRGVRFRYPQTASDALSIESFEVVAGERVFVRGPSGCGKTTLLSLVAGVLVATAGSVTLDGVDWASLSPARRDRRRAGAIGYVFQQFNLLPYLSVIENVLLPCRFSAARAARAGASPPAVRACALALLDRMELGHAFAARDAVGLSVGQQQRVAAARALIGRPELVVADEPTSALDEDLRESFMRVLLDVCAETRSALVFVSHDRRLASRFDRQVDLARSNRSESSALGETETA